MEFSTVTSNKFQKKEEAIGNRKTQPTRCVSMHPPLPSRGKLAAGPRHSSLLLSRISNGKRDGISKSGLVTILTGKLKRGGEVGAVLDRPAILGCQQTSVLQTANTEGLRRLSFKKSAQAF